MIVDVRIPQRTFLSTAIKALAFDAYGTLFDPHSVRDECERVFRANGPGNGAQLSHLWRAKQLEYTWLRSLMNRYEDFWQVTEAALRFSCASMKLECSDEQRDALMQQYLRLKVFPEVPDALAALAGRPLFILSNGTPQMLKAVVENAGLGKTFSAMLSVDAVKIYKPSPRVYELAVKESGLDKRAIGFVSSNGWDIAGAAAFGFQTFWINRQGAEPEELGVRSGVILGTLSELPALAGPAS